MSVLQHDLPDARVLDLYAGSGALGLEALSRGASHATFVEIASGPLKALRANVEKLGAGDAVEVVKQDALPFARALGRGAYDIVFADPPYERPDARALVQLFQTTHFAHILSVEHRASERFDDLADVDTRVYGDTALTFITADA